MTSETFISVEQAAKYLGCSTRRVRALLSQGRMTGCKVGFAWSVTFPIQCTVGQRGPLIKLRKDGRNLLKKRGIKTTNESTGKMKGVEILSTAESRLGN